MKPLEKVYWIRFALGIIAALASFGSFNTFLNSMSLAIIVYLLSYYVIKFKFRSEVQKTQKLFTAGIGIYFLSWIVFWSLFYTIIAGA
jgi:hypothetical protein